jgi:hypothetical protein
MGGFSLTAANAAIRLGYGFAVLAAPSKPFLGIPFAPDTDEFPEARLFVRAFAAHQLAVGLVGLASLRRRALRRPAMLLAAATDAADIGSALTEARARGRLDADLSGGIAFSAAGLLSALAALRGTPPSTRVYGPQQ